jgi:threonine dehydratase
VGSDAAPSHADVLAAAERIAPFVARTPILRCPALDELVGARLHLKAEHLQVGGAFKARGATNAVELLAPEVAERGVATHSSGNHAAALARAAARRGIECHVVMPTTAPRAKRDATVALGAHVVPCEPTMAARAAGLAAVLARTGATEVHPSADPAVVAGQATATLELLQDVPSIRTVVAPVGGGGLLSGAAIAARGLDPTVRVVGAEPAELADAHRSLAAGALRLEGNRTSIADGLAAVLGALTFGILRAHRVEVVTVTEEEIVDAMALLFGQAKQVVEPSAAAGLAAVLVQVRRGVDLGADVGLVLSGGNVDLDRLPFRGGRGTR